MNQLSKEKYFQIRWEDPTMSSNNHKQKKQHNKDKIKKKVKKKVTCIFLMF
jgi:hypothetical protein